MKKLYDLFVAVLFTIAVANVLIFMKVPENDLGIFSQPHSNMVAVVLTLPAAIYYLLQRNR